MLCSSSAPPEDLRKERAGDEEIAQGLRAPAAPAKDLGLSLSTHGVWLIPSVILVSEGFDTLFWPPKTMYAHGG